MSKRGIKDIYKLQKQASELFDKGLSQREVAERLGVSTRTLRRWQHNPKGLGEVLKINATKVLDCVVNTSQEEENPKNEPSLEFNETQITQSAAAFRDVLPRRYTEQVDDLLQLCLNALHQVLSSTETSAAHKLSACKIVQQMKNDSMLWVEKIEIGDNVSDFQLVQQSLRDIILHRNTTPKIIQAATVLLKACQVQAQIPSLVTPSQEEEYPDLRSLSDEELARRFAEVMRNS